MDNSIGEDVVKVKVTSRRHDGSEVVFKVRKQKIVWSEWEVIVPDDEGYISLDRHYNYEIKIEQLND